MLEEAFRSQMCLTYGGGGGGGGGGSGSGSGSHNKRKKKATQGGNGGVQLRAFYDDDDDDDATSAAADAFLLLAQQPEGSRARMAWDEDEEAALVAGVENWGPGRWNALKNDPRKSMPTSSRTHDE